MESTPLFSYIPEGDLKKALIKCYFYVVSKNYLRFFDHPNVSLIPGTQKMAVDDQGLVEIRTIPVQSDTEEWINWLEKYNIDEYEESFTLADLIREMSCHATKAVNNRSGEFFFTCASLGWMCNNLRYIAIHGLEKHASAKDLWDFDNYMASYKK